jgi:hypothetical protein
MAGPFSRDPVSGCYFYRLSRYRQPSANVRFFAQGARPSKRHSFVPTLRPARTDIPFRNADTCCKHANVTESHYQAIARNWVPSRGAL